MWMCASICTYLTFMGNHGRSVELLIATKVIKWTKARTRPGRWPAPRPATRQSLVSVCRVAQVVVFGDVPCVLEQPGVRMSSAKRRPP